MVYLLREGEMRVVTSAFFLVCLAGSAWATPVGAPAPEIDAGILGISAAIGLIYLMQRRKRG